MHRCGMATRAAAAAGSGGSKRIQQTEFTEKAWQAIVAGPELAAEASQQMVETEHLMKALLEQPNGLARRLAPPFLNCDMGAYCDSTL